MPHMRPSQLRLRHAAVASALMVAMGCTTDPAATSNFISSVAPGNLIQASGSAMLNGNAVGPQGISNLVSNNGGALISNNGSAIIASNGSRYRVADANSAEVPIANAIVYVTDPQEHFFASNGKPLTAATDGNGHYAFASGLPSNQVEIVNIMLSNDRREVGYTVTKAGMNTINVSLASTYVTEFLRARAASSNQNMSAYDLTQLPNLTQLTEQAIQAGDLAVPDLSISKIPTLNQTYAIAIGQNKQGLGDAWAKMLGSRVKALTTVAGTGTVGDSGDGAAATQATFEKSIGLARDGAGNLYVIDEGSNTVRRIDASGTITTIAGNGQASYSGDGGPATQAALNWPRTGTVGPDGNLYLADTLNQRIRKVDLHTQVITTFCGSPVMQNGSALNDFAGDGGPATQAKLAGVRGMAFDSKGDLIFTDSWATGGQSWDHIRKITRDGNITSIAGVDNQRGFNGDGLPARQTQLNYLNGLAIDAHDNIYFADTYNNRVRKIDAVTGTISTVAGNGNAGYTGDGGPATQAELDNPYGVVLDGQGRIYVSDHNNRVVRMVDLNGNIRTIAGGGALTGDGEATSLALTEPVDLLLEPAGNLLIADSRGAQVRRLWLQWGF